MVSFSQTAGIQSSQIDRLDDLARDIKTGDPRAVEATGPLSTGERLYVALAATVAICCAPMATPSPRLSRVLMSLGLPL